MKLEENLKQIGLTGSEGRVYLFILEQGLSSPSQIAKGTNIARTNCYHLLESLKSKGLIEEQAQGKRKAYMASDPDALLRALERKKEAAERIVPDLRALFTVQKNKPKIKFYDGLDQIREVYKETLGAADIDAFASTKGMLEASSDLFEWYGDEIKKKEIVFREIATHDSEEAEKKVKEKLGWQYDYKLLDKEHGTFQTDVLIWEDNIATITFEEPYFATIITSPTVAKTYRTMFKALWETL